MDREKNKKQFRPKREHVRNRDNNTVKNNDRGSVAGPSGVKKPKTEADKPIGFKTLETVLKIESETELILKLSSSKNGFQLLLDQQSIRADFMCLILAALAKASKSSTEITTTKLLVHLYMEIMPKLDSKSNFNRELKLYITDLNNHLAITSHHRQKHIEAVENLLLFLRRLQLTIYQKSYDAVRDLVQLIDSILIGLNRKGNVLNEYIVETMAQLNESVEKYEQTKSETEQTEVLFEPPDDFRKIPIYPDIRDILGDHEPFIRKNIIDGKYVAGVDHYLDVQFRLLREDFVRPLRNGISEYRHIKSNPAQKTTTKFRINDLNVYQNVQVYGSTMLHGEQIHFCKFDIAPFRNLRWQVKISLSIFFTTFFSIRIKSTDFLTFSTTNE